MPLNEVVATTIELVGHGSDSMTEIESTVDAITDNVIATLQDQAVRREVYSEVAEQLDEISIREVHYVLDALVSVLRGTAE